MDKPQKVHELALMYLEKSNSTFSSPKDLVEEYNRTYLAIEDVFKQVSNKVQSLPKADLGL